MYHRCEAEQTERVYLKSCRLLKDGERCWFVENGGIVQDFSFCLSLTQTHTHQIWVAFYEGVKVSACKRVCLYVSDTDGPEKQREGEGRAKIKEINDVLWGGSQASLIPYVCIWPHFRKVADFVQKAICTISLTFSGAETDSEHLNVCACVCSGAFSSSILWYSHSFHSLNLSVNPASPGLCMKRRAHDSF